MRKKNIGFVKVPWNSNHMLPALDQQLKQSHNFVTSGKIRVKVFAEVFVSVVVRRPHGD